MHHEQEFGRTNAWFATPRLRPDVVRRQRLLSRLDEGPFRYILISAPAGFGKTTLALEWLQSSTSAAAWVSLDALDNEPHRFFSKVASRLDRIESNSASELCTALEVRAPFVVLASRLLDVLRSIDRAVTLVLDDYQYIDAPEMHQFIAALPEQVPESFRLIILSRVDPPFPQTKLRLNGEALEIRERDLRFSATETIDLFASTAGIRLAPSAAAALEERTEGWAAGLQMAAISLRQEADVEAFIDSLTGSNRFIVEYLLEEVLQRQPAELQHFLLRTSILPRFDARSCGAVTEMDDASRLLSEVETANLFLVRLDEPHGWFRYHHLFAELLEERLRRLFPDEWDVLHDRASAWFEGEGDLTSAFYHAGRCSSHTRLLWLLERHGSKMLDRSEFAAFARWAERIPLPDARCYPGFLTEYTWVRLLTERFADIEPLLLLAEAAIDCAVAPYSEQERAALRGTVDTQRSYALRLRERYDESVAATRQALEGPAATSLRNRGLLYFNLGRAQSHLGATREARDAFEQAYACNLQARTWYHVLGVPAYVASIVAQTEGLSVAIDRLHASMAFARDKRLDDLPAFGFQHNQLGRFLYLQNDVQGAEASFRTAKELGEAGGIHSVLSNAVAGLARIHGARKEFSSARAALRDLEMLVQSSYPLLYESNLGVERAMLALEEGDAVYLDAWCEAQLAGFSEPFTTERESANLLLARVLLHKRDWPEAEAVIDWLCEGSVSRGRRLAHLLARIGRAILLDNSGRREEAVHLMSSLLTESAAQGLVRPFIEHGAQVRALIEEALSAQLEARAEVLARLLLGMEKPADNEAIPAFRQSLAMPLTEREQEVLFHLSHDLSYQSIADALFVSHDTVKTHVKHIYSKLGVSSRSGALARARREGFFLSDPANQA